MMTGAEGSVLAFVCLGKARIADSSADASVFTSACLLSIINHHNDAREAT
jgi:hypothetical protein